MPGKRLEFRIESSQTPRDLSVVVDHVILGGWSGRDKAALEKHMVELEAHGVPRPPTTPAFYPVSVDRLTLGDAVQVSGPHSSGEVEFFVVSTGGGLFVGLGSDQTDRKLEAHSITLSKQICDKVLAPGLWPIAELAPHWDSLRLRAWAGFDDGEALYQEGLLAEMLRPEELFEACFGAGESLPPGTLMFSGTIPAIGGIRPARSFRMELQDPVLQRSLSHAYEIEVLPVPA